MGVPVYNLVGEKYGRLRVTAYAGMSSRNGLHQWKCKCSCGSFLITAGKYLRNGDTLSCGCWQKEATSQAATTHGAKRGDAAPEVRSALRCWQNMMNRCYYLNSHKRSRYGGRGIKVCRRWHKFENFLADMGTRPSPKHSIERINNDGNYTPINCRWATALEQMANTSRSIPVTYKGVTRSASYWEKHFKLKKGSLIRAIRRGRSLTDLLPRLEVV